MAKPVTRFAPSPTGRLHLGHAAHMLYVWGLADLLGSEVVLRVEDHDRERCKPEHEYALFEDLDWLGFRASNVIARGASDFRQSECGPAYQAALDALAAEHPVYRCRCSRKDLAAEPAEAASGERRYPGTCRTRDHPPDMPHGVRVAWAADERPEAFTDGLMGPQEQRPEMQCGDLLLRDRLGNWTYQFAVTVDDLRHGVNVVVRGDDLLASTGRQVRLARMLGRAEPAAFFHHPLVRDDGGRKLSKQQRPPSLAELRRGGMSAGAALGRAARSVGLLASDRELKPREAADLILSRHPGVEGAARP